MRLWLYRLFGIPHFHYRGELYNGNHWEIVNDPSDSPSIGWRPPRGNWSRWQQDKMLRRKLGR